MTTQTAARRQCLRGTHPTRSDSSPRTRKPTRSRRPSGPQTIPRARPLYQKFALVTLCQVEAVFKIEACTLRILGCKRTGVGHQQSFLPVTTTNFAGALPQVKGYLSGAIASRYMTTRPSLKLALAPVRECLLLSPHPTISPCQRLQAAIRSPRDCRKAVIGSTFP